MGKHNHKHDAKHDAKQCDILLCHHCDRSIRADSALGHSPTTLPPDYVKGVLRKRGKSIDESIIRAARREMALKDDDTPIIKLSQFVVVQIFSDIPLSYGANSKHYQHGNLGLSQFTENTKPIRVVNRVYCPKHKQEHYEIRNRNIRIKVWGNPCPCVYIEDEDK